MDTPWKPIIVSSLAATSIITQFAPNLAPSTSYVLKFLSFFFALSAASFIWQVIIYPKLLSPIRHLPRPSGASFLNGHYKIISAEPTGKPFKRWINETPNDGLIYYNYVFNAERLFVTNPKALAEVLVHKSYDFVKPRAVVQGLGRLLGIGILVAEGEEHKLQRKNLMPAFHFRHVKDLYPIFWAKSREMAKALARISQPEGTLPVKNLKDAPVVEISDWASRATLDIIGLAGMGQDFNAIGDPTNELTAAYRRVFTSQNASKILSILYFIIPFWLLRILPFRQNLAVFQAVNIIKRTCRQLIRSKQKRLEQKEKRVEVDILSVAIESGGFTEDQLVNQLMTFLAAGHETTATAVTWAAHLLCLHPDVQTRLRQEIRENLPPIDSEEASITAQTLDRLPYLHAVCNEILRVNPPVPMTLREAGKDTSILGNFVPKGTRVILPPSAVNLSEALWGANPDKFDPDRWLGSGKANTGGADSNYAFLTFLHGPRSCIGQSFAKAEFACLLAALVGRFEMELEDAEKEMEFDSGITMKPKHGLPVRLRLIEGW
ncbi:hypothetical protein MMC07_006008 [Pseudocyphellaria aurata]|nr:hypothetical protein [Pseudocyphellaria aurata]